MVAGKKRGRTISTYLATMITIFIFGNSSMSTLKYGLPPIMVANTAKFAGSLGGLKSLTCAGLMDVLNNSGGDILISRVVGCTQALGVGIIGQSMTLNSIRTVATPIPVTRRHSETREPT